MDKWFKNCTSFYMWHNNLQSEKAIAETLFNSSLIKNALTCLFLVLFSIKGRRNCLLPLF